MGMSYQYAGSASYPRFDHELISIAEIFGGVPTSPEESERLREEYLAKSYSWEHMTDLEHYDARFVFPEGTDKNLARWFNCIYGSFDEEETYAVWNFFKEHSKKIRNLSPQIWDELSTCVQCGGYWHIV